MTAMTALASYWPAAAEHGWPGIIIAGVFLTGILGAGLGGAAIAWRTIRPLPSPAGGGTAGPAASVTSSQPTGDATSRYLQSALVAGGSDCELPKFRARFGRIGREAVFYIEYSFYVGSGGIEWTLPRKIVTYRQSRFVTGEIVDFPILRPCMTNDGRRWQFIQVPEANSADDLSRDLLGAGTWYRGRITLLAADDIQEHCYFVAETGHDPSAMPKVIGQHMFDHFWAWGEPRAARW